MFLFYVLFLSTIILAKPNDIKFIIFCPDNSNTSVDCYEYNKNFTGMEVQKIILDVCQKVNIFCLKETNYQLDNYLICPHGIVIKKKSTKNCYNCYQTYCCNPNNTNSLLNIKLFAEGHWWQKPISNYFNNCTKFGYQKNNFSFFLEKNRFDHADQTGSIEFMSFLLANNNPFALEPQQQQNFLMNYGFIIPTILGAIGIMFIFIILDAYDIPFYLFKKLTYHFQRIYQD
jgi:hypothetical protein